MKRFFYKVIVVIIAITMIGGMQGIQASESGTETATVSEATANNATDSTTINDNNDNTSAKSENGIPKRVKDIENTLIDVNKTLDGVKNTLESMAINVKDFGAIGDGTIDDTNAIQSALNLCITSGRDLFFPVGTYKVTQPITIERSSTDVFYTPKLYGEGMCLGNSANAASTIKGYNIPAKRAVLEILGSRNGQTVSPYIENLGIIQDLDTCDPLSFCMYLGDSRQMLVNRVFTYGYNGVLLRSGTKIGAKDYADICLKFTQVEIKLPMYYGWDGKVVDSRNQHGWAFLHEIAFSDNKAGYVMDNVVFDSCVFHGSVFVYTAATLFQNCMWYIPGFVKTSLALSDGNYSKAVSSKTFDFGNGLWIAGGNVRLQNCYFEDVPKCIYINTINGFNAKVFVTTSHFNGRSNFSFNGKGYLSDYVASIDSYGSPGIFTLENSSVNDGPVGTSTPWYATTVKNNINDFNIVAKNNDSNNFSVTDKSYLGAVLNINEAKYSKYNYNTTFNTIFSGMKLLNASAGKLSISDLTKYKIPVYCRLKRVDIYTNAKMSSDWKVVIDVGGVTKYALPIKEISIANDYCNEIYTETGKNSARYSFEKLLDQSPYNTTQSTVNSFKPNDLVGVRIVSTGTSIAADNNIDCSVELTFSYD